MDGKKESCLLPEELCTQKHKKHQPSLCGIAPKIVNDASNVGPCSAGKHSRVINAIFLMIIAFSTLKCFFWNQIGGVSFASLFLHQVIINSGLVIPFVITNKTWKQSKKSSILACPAGTKHWISFSSLFLSICDFICNFVVTQNYHYWLLWVFSPS